MTEAVLFEHAGVASYLRDYMDTHPAYQPDDSEAGNDVDDEDEDDEDGDGEEASEEAEDRSRQRHRTSRHSCNWYSLIIIYFLMVHTYATTC